ncbi:MAG: DNA internalization-related competence protein ComEC/Rec2 [Chloroflexota bacterium]
MSQEARQPGHGGKTDLSPTAWLIAPTLALLFGQTMAAGPWNVPPAGAAVVLLPVLFFIALGRRRWAVLSILCALAFTLGYFRHRQLMFPEFAENHLRTLIPLDARVYLEGRLGQEPEKLVNRIRWQVVAQRIWHPTGALEITGDILITLRSARRDWRYGDRVRFWVRPLAPQNSGNPGGFDYATFLSRRGIYVTGFLDDDQEVELLAREPGAGRGLIEDLRRAIRRFVERNVSRENGALLSALVVGDMGTIPKETRAAFTAAGVNHVLSISGLHVAMLGLVVFALVRYGGAFSSYLLLRINLLKLAACFSFVAVVFYTALAGAMVPTVRSAIMIGVYQLAVLLDREEEVLASLTLAALLIALIWPGVVADISFQLSFLAVLFIVWGMHRLHRWLALKRTDDLPQERHWLRERLKQASLHLAVPLLATLGTGPLIAHYFGHLSIAGFIANPFIVPLVGFVVVPLGLVIGFLAVVAPQLGLLLIGAAETMLGLTTWLVHAFASLPWANFSVPSPDALEIAALYGVLICLFAFGRTNHRLIALALGLTLLLADVTFWWNERFGRKELRVTHLNVGQGDAAVVELPNSQVLLIDAGGAAVGDFDTGENIVAPFLRARKILKIDYLVVSHARVDHYGGMNAIIKEFSPREFWSSATRGQTHRFEELEESLEYLRIPRIALNGRQPCRVLGAVKICALYPPADKSDDRSVVLRLEFGKLRYLFAGDIDKRDEAALLDHADAIRSAVIKVPRHGSTTASTKEFIATVKPRLAIVSAGMRSRAEAQREEIIQRYRQEGAEALSTFDDGAIIVESDGKTLHYAGYKSGKRGKVTF